VLRYACILSHTTECLESPREITDCLIMLAKILIAHLGSELVYSRFWVFLKHTRMLSFIRLFLYPFSSASSRCVSAWFCLSVLSIQATSLTASGSRGPMVSRWFCASRYLLISCPLFASLTTILRASTPRTDEQMPMRRRRSSLVRPEDPLSVLLWVSSGCC